MAADAGADEDDSSESARRTDTDRQLHEEIAMSRRSILATIGAGGLAAGYAVGRSGNLEGADADGLYAAGVPNLTSQYERKNYFAAPSSVFDKTAMETGEAAIVTDDYGLAVKDEDGNMEVPPYGSAAKPAPSVATEGLNHVTFVATSDDLNSIIENAEAGDYFYLLPGTHKVTKSGLNALEVVVDNVTIEGAGRETTTIKLEDNASTDAGSAGDEAVLSLGVDGGASPSGITLRGVAIDGNKANNSTTANERIHGLTHWGASDVTIEDFAIRNTTNGGLVQSGKIGADWQIDALVIEDCHRDGFILGVDGLTASNLIVRNCATQDGIEPTGADHTYTNCIVENVAGSAFDLYGADNVTISNSWAIVGDNGPSEAVNFQGIDASNPTEGCVAQVHLLGSGVTGASFTVDRLLNSNSLVSACRFHDATARGPGAPIQLSDDAELTVAGLTLLDPQGVGIQVQSSGNDASPLVIRDVRVQNPPSNPGVDTESGSVGATLEGITVAGGGNVGFRVRGDNHTFRDCEARDNSNRGFSIQGGGTHTFEDCKSVSNGSFGYDVSDVDNMVFAGNTSKDNSLDGLRVRATDGATHDIGVVSDFRSDGDSDGIELTESSGTINIVIDNFQVIGQSGSVLNNSATGVVFLNGTHLISGSDASGADYDADDAGRRIIKTDATKKEWVVEADGTLNQIV